MYNRSYGFRTSAPEISSRSFGSSLRHPSLVSSHGDLNLESFSPHVVCDWSIPTASHKTADQVPELVLEL